MIDARDFGVTGDAADDQTAALQDAVDHAQSRVVGNTYGAPSIELPAGQITLTSTITLKSATLIGQAPNVGTRIVWNGPAGCTALQKWPTSHAGNNSFGGLERINFRSGTTEPQTWLDLTNSLIDVMFRMRDVHFSGCAGDAITAASWINCHWEHLRFDNCGGWAIRLTPGASQNLSSFVLDKFTYDHNRASSPGGGVVLVDNSANASNLGVFALRNGRIEINAAWAPADAPGVGSEHPKLRAVVGLRSSNSPSTARDLGLHISDVTYADATGMGDDCLLFRDTTNATGSPTLLWANVRALNLSKVIGGPYSAFFAPPSVADLAGMGAINTQSGGAGLVYGMGSSRLFSGRGSPEGSLSAAVGSIFVNHAGAPGTVLYVKTAGTGNAGWSAVA